ncbi:MAG: D-alanine--D-alanine ligase [Candidatus Moraniibacteriota bacterium]|jgi:D-alanine-D-alanine ligase
MKKNIVVIFGGNNSEHDVSLNSAKNVVDAIDVNKYDVINVAILKNGNWIIGEDAEGYLNSKQDNFGDRNDISEFVKMAENIDLVMPILHGEYGEDGRLQGFLDILNIKYVFSNHTAHAIAMDKARSKIVTATEGVRIISGAVLGKDEGYDLQELVVDIGFPVFIKPNSAGSSVGISKVEKESDLESAIEKAFLHSDKVLIEKNIVGRELTVGIIELNGKKEVLPIVEIIPKTESWYDYEAKYADGGSEHICPAKISSDVEKIVKEYAEKSFDAIGCKDLARVDFLLDEKNEDVYFLEINTIPGMTSTSLVPDAAREAGIPFEQLINNLIGNNL